MAARPSERLMPIRRSALRGRCLAFLAVLAGPQSGEVFPLPAGRTPLIGRRPDADVLLRDDGASRRHATIEVDEHGARPTDLQGANGTFVDGFGRPRTGSRMVLASRWGTSPCSSSSGRRRSRRAGGPDGPSRIPSPGFFNRRHLGDRLEAELSAALRHGRPLSPPS